ncbi:hypothetical protein UF75_4002 [Desulfosporosinus sp. I2]|nr:hypothetical protein UF75_4002 [Desulfosporosinus sp. I2]
MLVLLLVNIFCRTFFDDFRNYIHKLHLWSILREKGSGTREVAEKALEDLDITPAHVLELGSIQIIKGAVEAGLGISVLSNWTVRKELSD